MSCDGGQYEKRTCSSLRKVQCGVACCYGQQSDDEYTVNFRLVVHVLGNRSVLVVYIAHYIIMMAAAIAYIEWFG